MKKFFYPIAVLVLLCCSSNDETTEETIFTDISVSTSVSTINWNDATDLMQKLDNALNYNYGVAAINETLRPRNFNADTTQVVASISFTAVAQNTYNDSNLLNNSVTIDLVREGENPTPQGVELKADGPGNTYALITSVLAPGQNPIEVPDCNHATFGEHIDEVFDTELNTNVFRFFIHTTPDNDRCINFDRQRNEIKTYSPSPDNLLGVEEETVIYKWKFKLNEGFQSSPNFTHLHQLKSVGGSLDAMPMYTLTARKSSPDRIELRYAETDSQITLVQTEIAPFIGSWLEVTETIKYGISGTYDIEIKKVSDGTVLLDYSTNDIINWRPEAEFVRPKWGIYRSLINEQDLRDEEVLFADFSITEI